MRYYHHWMVDDSLSEKLAFFFTSLLLVGPVSYFALIGVLRYCFYREMDPLSDAELPLCTVIVPAYNEGNHVLSTLRSIAESDYPPEKLEIFAVNDGSIDDTVEWMYRASSEYPGRITVIDCPRNRGKRHALYEGFIRGRGRVFVTVDSDSTVARDALRWIVSPIARDPGIGAVAGSVRVNNLGNGIFPGMMEAGFTFAFDFIRCGQSVMRDVICTPGAISAYNAEAVEKVRECWVNQTFLGKTACIGEDRALTNLMLRDGYGVVIQRSAKITTNVPETYRGVAKMLLRWERSNMRENFRMYQFIFKDFRWNDLRRWFLLLTLLVYTQAMLLPAVMLWASLYYIVITEGGVLISILSMTLLWATLPAVVNLQHRSTKLVCYCYLYGIMHALTLFWLVPYALFTLYDSRWMTRTAANSAGKG